MTEMIKAYAPQYKSFEWTEGRTYGAYGLRLTYNGMKETQIEMCIKRLREDVNTRQAQIVMWEKDDLITKQPDLPCTSTLKFYIRDGKLHMITDMRSNDVWLGLPYDIFCFTTLQQIMARELEVGLGEYTHNVGSLHLYEKHEAAAMEALDEEPSSMVEPYNVSEAMTLKEARTMVLVERELRTNKIAVTTDEKSAMFEDFLHVFTHKWCGVPVPPTINTSFFKCLLLKGLTS